MMSSLVDFMYSLKIVLKYGSLFQKLRSFFKNMYFTIYNILFVRFLIISYLEDSLFQTFLIY